MQSDTLRLDLGTFPVRDVVFGTQTRLNRDILEINRVELLELIRRDRRIVGASLEIVRPGDSVRVTTVHDVLEPRVKVEGPGQTYPGVCDRSVELVGRGRTHRLSGMAVVEITKVPRYQGARAAGGSFIDLSGPGRQATPYGSLVNLCAVLEPDPELTVEEQNWASHAAALAVQDRLAATTIGQEPPEHEIFELGPVDPALPKIAYILGMNSPQHYAGSLTAYGAAIYGLTRQTTPWYLHPNEFVDGAVSIGPSWVQVNNPIVLGLARRHGLDVNFLGAIAIRTRWTAQAEKDVTSQQAAKLAFILGAQGVIITYDGYGNDFMEAIRAVEACERLGLKTVFVTSEEPPESSSEPLLEPLPEANAIVSTGVGRSWLMGRESLRPKEDALPAVERVIGAPEIIGDPGTGEGSLDARGPLPGARYSDSYGVMRQSCFSY